MFRILGLIAYLEEIPIIRVDYESLAMICTNQLVGYQYPGVFSIIDQHWLVHIRNTMRKSFLFTNHLSCWCLFNSARGDWAVRRAGAICK